MGCYRHSGRVQAVPRPWQTVSVAPNMHVAGDCGAKMSCPHSAEAVLPVEGREAVLAREAPGCLP